MATTTYPNIILFTYEISVFGRRMDFYLTFRGIPYSKCIQPPNMPRQDLERLGINYRRMPILAIGRDVYIDTRLIIEKLEEIIPQNRLSPETPFEQGLQKIIEGWVIDAGPFWKTSGCIPLSTPVVNDPVWMKDRYDGSGGQFTLEALRDGRAACLTQLALYFSYAENLMADGRQWIFGTDGPTTGDVHAIWSFDWAINMGLHVKDQNTDDNMLIEARYPKVFAWVSRYKDAYAKASEKNGKPSILSSEDAVQRILNSQLQAQQEDVVDETDPLMLKKGQRVSISPTDFGFTHADEGELLRLNLTEAIISVRPKEGGGFLRLHYPRINFKIVPIEAQQT